MLIFKQTLYTGLSEGRKWGLELIRVSEVREVGSKHREWGVENTEGLVSDHFLLPQTISEAGKSQGRRVAGTAALPTHSPPSVEGKSSL